MNCSSFSLWWSKFAVELKTDVIAMAHAMRHPGTPWYARIFVALIVAYAVSPIDLIPDFIPVFGYLDDFLLIPIGALIARRLILADIWAESRSASLNEPLPRSLYFLGICMVLFGWLATAYFLFHWLF